MSRQLWLLRHAEAEPHGTREDAERKLTSRGKGQAQTAGIALARIEVKFDAVLYSPKVRGRETAEIAAAQWSAAQRSRLEVYEPLAGGFDANDLPQALAKVSEEGRLLLVGHEPDLSQLVRQLTGGAVDLKKGGVAMVRLDDLAGELALLLRPRELALIAGAPAGA
jgi:phosphohistidine phosphatase